MPLVRRWADQLCRYLPTKEKDTTGSCLTTDDPPRPQIDRSTGLGEFRPSLAQCERIGLRLKCTCTSLQGPASGVLLAFYGELSL